MVQPLAGAMSLAKAWLRAVSGWVCLLWLVASAFATRRHIVVVALGIGRLGNRLFLCSHVFAAACARGFTVVAPVLAEYADCFSETAGSLVPRFPGASRLWPITGTWLRRAVARAIEAASRAAKRVHAAGAFSVVELDDSQAMDLGSPDFLAVLQRSRVVFLRGWLFRDAESLGRHGDAVRSFLAPHPRFHAAIDEPVEQLRSQCDVVVGVAIRHGDYRAHLGGRYFFGLESYVRVMRQYLALILHEHG